MQLQPSAQTSGLPGTSRTDGARSLTTSQDDNDEADVQVSSLFRTVSRPADFETNARALCVPPLMRIPLSVSERFANAWTACFVEFLYGGRRAKHA